MGQQYLIDTNAVIDYIHNKLPASALHLIDNIELNISVITRIELLVWQNATDNQIKALNGFISSCNVHHLEEKVIIESISIRKTYRIKLPDAIIAATASVNNQILITRNISDFQSISYLRTYNPWI
jgi:predicted nucleic acid-binding protein